MGLVRLSSRREQFMHRTGVLHALVVTVRLTCERLSVLTFGDFGSLLCCFCARLSYEQQGGEHVIGYERRVRDYRVVRLIEQLLEMVEKLSNG